LVVRPGDHELAREFLAGTRWLLLVCGLAPIVAAASLAIGGQHGWVRVIAGSGAALTTAAAIVLWAGVVLPLGDARMPLSRGSADDR
jgi:hypothetical protein